jgi:hypothetical protein
MTEAGLTLVSAWCAKRTGVSPVALERAGSGAITTLKAEAGT